jgi:hypothetical protein
VLSSSHEKRKVYAERQLRAPHCQIDRSFFYFLFQASVCTVTDRV